MNSKILAFSQTRITGAVTTLSYVSLPEPIFDAYNYPDMWAEQVLLSHIIDEEIEVNRASRACPSSGS